jgi:radical SAM-linked protein
MVGAKYRFRFRKCGALRFLSHHDLVRCLGRMIRRAALPVRMTGGFHPQPRIVFPLSLPLGIIGQCEPLELELTDDLPDDDLLRRLQAEAPDGFDLLSISRIGAKVTGIPCRADYRLPLPPEACLDLPDRCQALRAMPDLFVERRHPQPRRVNIRPYVLELLAGPDGLAMQLRVTPTGAARADEVADALGLLPWLRAGAVLERTHVDLIDETATADLPDQPLESSATVIDC